MFGFLSDIIIIFAKYIISHVWEKVKEAHEKLSQEFGKEPSWQSFNWTGSSVIQDQLNTADDALAQAEYETQSAILQSQDKMMDVELRQVETQHQAAQTEYDSVKKVIDKNIERSFKTFG